MLTNVPIENKIVGFVFTVSRPRNFYYVECFRAANCVEFHSCFFTRGSQLKFSYQTTKHASSQFERWYTAPELVRRALRLTAWLTALKECNSSFPEIGLVNMFSLSNIVDSGVLSSDGILIEKLVYVNLIKHTN